MHVCTCVYTVRMLVLLTACLPGMPWHVMANNCMAWVGLPIVHDCMHIPPNQQHAIMSAYSPPHTHSTHSHMTAHMNIQCITHTCMHPCAATTMHNIMHQHQAHTHTQHNNQSPHDRTHIHSFTCEGHLLPHTHACACLRTHAHTHANTHPESLTPTYA